MNKVHFIMPATNTESVYVTLVFNYGFFNESKNEYGSLHLFEHYFAKLFNLKYPSIKLYPSTDNISFKLLLESESGNIKKDLANLLNFLTGELEENENILNAEKNRIAVEYAEKNYQFDEFLKQESKKYFLLGHENIKRKDELQIKNLSKLTFDNLVKFRRELLKKNVCFFIMCTKDIQVELSKLIEEKLIFFSSKKPKTITLRKATFNQKLIVKREHDIVAKNNNYLVLLFEGLYLDASLSDKYTLIFLLKEINNVLKYEVEELGGYYFDYKNLMSKYFSLIYFYTQIPIFENERFEELFFNTVNKVIDDKTILSKILNFVNKEKQELKANWNNNLERLDWVVNDMVDFDRIITLEEMENALDKVEISTITTVSNLLSKNCLSKMLFREL